MTGRGRHDALVGVVWLLALLCGGCAMINAFEDPPQDGKPADTPCSEDAQCPDGQNCQEDQCVPADDPCEGLRLPPNQQCLAPGTFTMGSPQDEIGRDALHEVPTEVTLTHALLIQTTEVTQAQWGQHFELNPSFHADCPQCPVELVNWWEALQYLNALSSAEGLPGCYFLSQCQGDVGVQCSGCEQKFRCRSVRFEGIECQGWRLPTEAEWEYATRAGSTEAFYSGPITDPEQDSALDDTAWYAATAGDTTQEVGQLRPNAFGLYDTHGGVFEWVWDRFAPYAAGPLTDPTGPDPFDTLQVIRGGSYRSTAAVCRSAARAVANPDLGDRDIGLRPVRTVVR